MAHLSDPVSDCPDECLDPVPAHPGCLWNHEALVLNAIHHLWLWCVDLYHYGDSESSLKGQVVQDIRGPKEYPVAFFPGWRLERRVKPSRYYPERAFLFGLT